MRKTFLIIAILAVSLISTACVNKFAVQELNNKAQELLKSGNVEGAISRLESSIDLDETVFETHYNLAVAYMQAKKYDKAMQALEKVKELKPDFADTYHSIAVINEEKAYDIISGKTDEESQEDGVQKNTLTDEDKQDVCNFLGAAIDNYNTYIVKKADASDKDKVNSKIDELNKELRKYSEDSEVQNDGVKVE